MTSNSKLIPAIFAIGSAIFSCATAQSAPAQLSIPKRPESMPATSKKDDAATPAKIQQEFQNEFARQLAAAGKNAEGWALFSDSPMGHNGQRWIIRSSDTKKAGINHCFIKQGESACKITKLSAKELEQILPALKTGDKLTHIIPTAFDALSFEFLHARQANPETKRVVFISSDKPFPEDYENLIKAFNR